MVFTGAVDLLIKVFPGKKFTAMSPLEAELTKYIHNVFGAYKVTYFNAATSLRDDETVKYTLLINPEMTEMAIQMTDGRVLASSEKVYDIYMEYFTYNAANGTTSIASGIPAF